MSRLILQLLLLPTSLTTLTLAQSNCYHPNGVDQNGEWGGNEYQRCGKKDTHSMCCRWNSTLYPDKCRSDGLCAWEYDQSFLWRESCTDPTWESEGCLKLCIEGKGKVVAGDDTEYELSKINVQITRCGDGSLCCGELGSEMAVDCCEEGKGVWIQDGKVVTEDPTKTSTSTSMSSTSTSRTTSTSSSSWDTAQSSSSTSATAPQGMQPPSSQSPTDSRNSTGIIAGAVVGGVVGLVLLVALAWFLLRQRKLSNPYAHAQLHSEAPTEPGTPLPTTKYAHYSVNEVSDPEVHEVCGKGIIHEISQSKTVHEVSGKGTVFEIFESRPVHEMEGSGPSIAELEGCTVKK